MMFMISQTFLEASLGGPHLAGSASTLSIDTAYATVEKQVSRFVEWFDATGDGISHEAKVARCMGRQIRRNHRYEATNLSKFRLYGL